MFDLEAQRHEVRANYGAFEAALPNLLSANRGKFAALRHKEIVGIFDSFADALVYCSNEFSDQMFSVQEITDAILTYGPVTYAANSGDL